jgi:hypothetical protein
MNNDDNSNPEVTGVSRRATLTLAAGVAALGMRSNACAQGKGEAKWKAGAREKSKPRMKERVRAKEKSGQRARMKAKKFGYLPDDVKAL